MVRRALLLIAVITVSAGAATVKLPDPRTGNVNGIGGVMFWPADLPAANGDPQPLSTVAGCEAHLVAYTSLDNELTYPCGEWFVLPSAGHYEYWLERDGRMAPAMGLLLYARQPFSGKGLASIVPITPAGRVVVPPEKTMSSAEDLRLISVEARHGWGTRIFDRRVLAANAHAPVQMPEGRIVAGRFDRKTNDAIALTRPLEVVPGKTVVVWPTQPAGSDVLLVLTKPSELQFAKPFAAAIALDKRAPDVLLNAHDRIVAIWYGVAARRATLSMQSDAAYWPPQQIVLTPGRVATIRSSVQRLPKAHVSIAVPPGTAITEPMSLEATGRRLSVAPGTYVLEDLPAEPLKITLSIGAWRLSELADLSSGHDANVDFELKPIAVTGTVFHGDERVPAEIDFLNDKEWRTVKTNERGEYATTFWWPKVHTARVKIANLPPYLDTFREISDSGTVDFRVPRTDYLVRVHDAATGKGIAHAQVSVGNDSPDTRVTTQRLTTDDAGVAVLPPLRRGELILNAWADRYANAEQVRAKVDEQHHEIDIDLKPLPSAATLQLRLADGAPAAQAEAWAFDAALAPLWRGTADDNGRLDLPELSNPLLLVRHPLAASAIRALASRDETWTLDRPAGPLTLVAKSGAAVALWLDGVKLTGPPLAFAAWSTPMTTANGLWIARNLPPRSVRVLLLPASALGSAAYDAVARSIDYPWPAPIAAPVVQ